MLPQKLERKEVGIYWDLMFSIRAFAACDSLRSRGIGRLQLPSCPTLEPKGMEVKGEAGVRGRRDRQPSRSAIGSAGGVGASVLLRRFPAATATCGMPSAGLPKPGSSRSSSCGSRPPLEESRDEKQRIRAEEKRVRDQEFEFDLRESARLCQEEFDRVQRSHG